MCTLVVGSAQEVIGLVEFGTEVTGRAIMDGIMEDGITTFTILTEDGRQGQAIMDITHNADTTDDLFDNGIDGTEFEHAYSHQELDEYLADLEYGNFECMMEQLKHDVYNLLHHGHEDGPEAYAAEFHAEEELAKEAEESFENGIDGEPWAECSAEDGANFYGPEEDCREDFDVHKENGLDITGWPTYGNYVIITDTFHMYWWPGSGAIDIFDKRKPHADFPSIHEHVLTIKPYDLFFFCTPESNKEKATYLTGEEVNKKVQRYINLRAFV